MSRSNPIDKDEQLEQALDAVAEIEPDFESALLTAADADTEYEIAYAKAYLAAEGTIQNRENAAKVASAKYLKARNDAKAVKEFLRAKLKDRQDAVSARQSLLRADLRTNERF
jgi:hypothetical protein